jgi:hypothetical protein
MQRNCKKREIRLKTGKNGHGKKLRESAGKKNPDSRGSFVSHEKTVYNFVTISYISVGNLTGA